MSSLPLKDQSPQLTKNWCASAPTSCLRPWTAAKSTSSRVGPPIHLASGHHARRLYGDLAELRALRLKQVGGSVYKRAGSRFWQIQYLVDGKWRQESSHTESKRDAEALLREKVFRASVGKLPGTVTFEQVIDALVAEAGVRGLKAAARLADAARALKARLEGYRAEDCNHAVWLKYAEDRQREAARDTVHLELSVAKRAYKLADVNGLSRASPIFR